MFRTGLAIRKELGVIIIYHPLLVLFSSFGSFIGYSTLLPLFPAYSPFENYRSEFLFYHLVFICFWNNTLSGGKL